MCKYTVTFSQEALKQLRFSGKSIHQLERELNVPQSVLIQWIHQAAVTEDCPTAPEDTADELDRLRSENARLRMAQDVLRKNIKALFSIRPF